jgi:hypothetical protein
VDKNNDGLLDIGVRGLGLVPGLTCKIADDVEYEYADYTLLFEESDRHDDGIHSTNLNTN